MIFKQIIPLFCCAAALIAQTQPLSFLYCPGGVTPCIQIPYASVPTPPAASGGAGTLGVPGHTPFPFTGAGVPSSSLGVDGDTYLNSTTGDYYTHVSGAWTLGANLRGTAGASGATNPATSTTLGGVKAGSGVTVAPDGTISVSVPAPSVAGGYAPLDSSGLIPVPALPTIPASKISGAVNIAPSFTTAGTANFDPACNTFYPAGSSSPCVSTAPAITLSVSSANATVLIGGTGTQTLTVTAANLISPITPTVTGLPANVTAAFNPATVPSTGGTTTLTYTATGGAAPGSSAVTFGATSGSTTAPTITSTLTVSYPANLLTSVSVVDPLNNLNNGTQSGYFPPAGTGSLDWISYGSDTARKVRANGVPAMLSDVSAVSYPPRNACNGALSTANLNYEQSALVWPTSDATNTLSPDPGYNFTIKIADVSCFGRVVATLPDTSPHTFVLVTTAPIAYTAPYPVYSMVAHMVDGSSPDVSVPVAMDTSAGPSGGYAHMNLLTFKARTATVGGTQIQFTLVDTTSSTSNLILFKGAAVLN